MGKYFYRPTRLQNSDYLNFWRLVSRQIGSSLCEMTLNQFISSQNGERKILQVGTVE